MNNWYFVIAWLSSLIAVVLSISELFGEMGVYCCIFLAFVSSICLKFGLDKLEKTREQNKQYYAELKNGIEAINTTFEKNNAVLVNELLELKAEILKFNEYNANNSRLISEGIGRLITENNNNMIELGNFMAKNAEHVNTNLGKLVKETLCNDIQKNVTLINSVLSEINSDSNVNAGGIKRKLEELIEVTEEHNNSVDEIFNKVSELVAKYDEMETSLKNVYGEFKEENEQYKEFLKQYQKLSSDDVKILQSIYKDINYEKNKR